MPNEMIRPCTLPASWKQPCGRPIEPFDAMEYLYYELKFSYNSIGAYSILLFKSTGVLRRATFCCGEGKGDIYDYVLPSAKIECHLLSLVIAEALNAPVLATEEVLAGLPKDAKIWKVWDDGLELCFRRCFNDRWAYNVVDAHSTMTGGGCDVEFEEKELCSADRIKPDDPKTAEYLRQFTLKGVRIKEGG